MRRRPFLGVLLAVSLLSVPSAAWASDDTGLPLTNPPSLKAVPRGFAINAEQAIAIAKHTPDMQAFHRQVHPLQIQPAEWSHSRWFIAFYHAGILVAEADISPTGKVLDVFTGPQARAVWTHGNYSPLFDSPFVVGSFSLLFLLPFLSRRGLWRLSHLDGLMALSFLVSYELFDHGTLVPAVWMAYPPMLYLIGRLLWIGLRGGARPKLRVSSISPRLLIAGLIVLVTAREILSLANYVVIDVGAASVIGASRIWHGLPLYFASAGHGDTYGPIAYLAYLPFERIFPWAGTWGYLAAAHVANVFFDLVTIGGLVLLGRRMRLGREGLTLGVVMAWIWSACPFTLLAIIMHANDGLVAMLSVLGLLAFASPLGRGAVLGLAAAAKFSPAALLPLFAVGHRLARRGAALTIVGFGVVVAVSIFVWLPPGGLSEFWNHTIGYQLTRPDVFSPWALHPGLHPVAVALEILAATLAIVVALRPLQRDLAQVCALAGAVTIAVQLPAVHWFYYYIDWFVPFLAVALFAPLARPWAARDAVPVPVAEDGRSAALSSV